MSIHSTDRSSRAARAEAAWATPWRVELLVDFVSVAEGQRDVRTMGGNVARAWQWTGQLLGASAA